MRPRTEREKWRESAEVMGYSVSMLGAVFRKDESKSGLAGYYLDIFRNYEKIGKITAPARAHGCIHTVTLAYSCVCRSSQNRM